MHDVIGVFPTKVDTWFLALFWGIAVACFAGAPLIRRRSTGAAVLLGAIGVLFVGVGFNARSLRYEVRADGAVVTAGTVVPESGVLFHAGDVVDVRPTHESSSAPASSLDRLRVDLKGGRRVLVSPADKEGFKRALVQAGASL